MNPCKPRLARGQEQIIIYILSTDGLGRRLLPAHIELELTRLAPRIDHLVQACDGELDGAMLCVHGLSTLPAVQGCVRPFDLPAVLRQVGSSVVSRLWDGLFSLCREQPDIVVSLNVQWFVGSGLFHRFVRMHGTHGGLHRRASETFVVATSFDFESPSSSQDVSARLRSEYQWTPVARR